MFDITVHVAVQFIKVVLEVVSYHFIITFEHVMAASGPPRCIFTTLSSSETKAVLLPVT